MCEITLKVKIKIDILCNFILVKLIPFNVYFMKLTIFAKYLIHL